jgi:hypothetical protein
MKKNIVLFLILAVVLIQKNIIFSKNTGQEEDKREIKEFVEDYKKLMKGIVDEKAIDSVKITITDLEHPIVGLCWYNENPRRIQLDAKSWKSYDYAKKEALILHELGHCVCNLGHVHFMGIYDTKSKAPERSEDRLNSGFLEDGCPTSLMHPIVLNSECYTKHRAHYRYELHLRCYSASIRKNNSN